MSSGLVLSLVCERGRPKSRTKEPPIKLAPRRVQNEPLKPEQAVIFSKKQGDASFAGRRVNAALVPAQVSQETDMFSQPSPLNM